MPGPISSRWLIIGSAIGAVALAAGVVLGVVIERPCAKTTPPPANTTAMVDMVRALAQQRPTMAKKLLDTIPPAAPERALAQQMYDGALAEIVTSYKDRLIRLRTSHECTAYQATVDEVMAEKLEVGAILPCFAEDPPKSAAEETGTCDADALRQKAENYLMTGMDAAALAAFEASMQCRPDAAMMRFAFMAACRSKNAAKAQFYYPKLPGATTTGIVQICVRNGITLP